MTELLDPLLIVWEDRLAIAELQFDPLSGWRFRYLPEADRAKAAGFQIVPGFPQIEPGVWHHAPGLFPGLRKALPPMQRTDVQSLLGEHARLGGEAVFYWYLSITGGKVVGRGLRFVPQPKWHSPAGTGVADEAVRNDLRRVVVACRKVLVDDVAEQLESRLQIPPGGAALSVDQGSALGSNRSRLLEREDVLTTIRHHEANGLSRREAYDSFVRETAFTYLNRLAAIKLMEHPSRSLVRESVGAARASKGFKEFSLVAPTALRGKEDGGYRFYLECLFDEIAEEVGVLFDRTDPHSLVFPSMEAVTQVLTLINGAGIASAWADDETLGWIYQYFTPEEDRKKAHKENGRSGPKNAHELAFLNQFYTPSYVVDFLVRHTLEEMWKEMRDGRRPKTDPRKLRVLDLACGSGHFLLRAFDVLRRIYTDAYDDADLGPGLRLDYSDRNAFDREVPRLILAENVYGIDIDLRAVQIASLALYLRAQRVFSGMGIRGLDRPRIDRLNIVVAEAVPGEADLLEEFLAREVELPFLRDLARAIWQKTRQASEIGSLLKVDEELREEIEKAKSAYLALPKQRTLPNMAEQASPAQAELFFEGVSNKAFFDRADAMLFGALERYGRAVGPDTFRRRVFGNEWTQGVRFLEVLRERYDVVLMNPPFGRPSKGSEEYIRRAYPNSYNDLLAAFVERGLDLLRVGGRVGAITSRTGFFLSSFQGWREQVLMENRFVVMADLGSGVLDATVEVAAYVVERGPKNDTPARFLRVLAARDKVSALHDLEGAPTHPDLFEAQVSSFQSIPTTPFAYWLSEALLGVLSTKSNFEPVAAEVRQGLSTAADDIFVRAPWEIQPLDFMVRRPVDEPSAVRPSGRARWAFHVKSGSSQPWYAPLGAVVNWEDDGASIKTRFKLMGEVPSRYVRSEDQYFRPGFSWTRRAARFVPYVVPAGAIPSASRYQAFPRAGMEALAIGITASNTATAYLRIFGEWFPRPNFLVENLKSLPWPPGAEKLRTPLEELVYREVKRRRAAYSYFEPFLDFVGPLALDSAERPAQALEYNPESLLGHELEVRVAEAYGFTEGDLQILERDLREALSVRRGSAGNDGEEEDEDGGPDEGAETVIVDSPATRAEALMSYAIGCLFGRWDVRIGRDRSLAPKAAGPFDPLPFVAPGTLVGPDGFPASPDSIVSEEWLRARPDALHLPPEGDVARVLAAANEYPLECAWGGAIPDDADDSRDLVRGIGNVLEVLYGDQASVVEAEICKALSVRDLRTYLRNPRAFFQAHIQRYSALKGKRKAPIYWLLQSEDRSYALWLYYHRLSKDTLYRVLREHVEPRLRRAESAYQDARARSEAAVDTKKSRGGKALETGKLGAQVDEIRDFKRKIEEVQRTWDPDLDDGVLLNIAPLSDLVPWPNAKKAWKELGQGKHEWSKIAGRLKPNAG